MVFAGQETSWKCCVHFSLITEREHPPNRTAFRLKWACVIESLISRKSYYRCRVAPFPPLRCPPSRTHRRALPWDEVCLCPCHCPGPAQLEGSCPCSPIRLSQPDLEEKSNPLSSLCLDRQICQQGGGRCRGWGGCGHSCLPRQQLGARGWKMLRAQISTITAQWGWKSACAAAPAQEGWGAQAKHVSKTGSSLGSWHLPPLPCAWLWWPRTGAGFTWGFGWFGCWFPAVISTLGDKGIYPTVFIVSRSFVPWGICRSRVEMGTAGARRPAGRLSCKMMPAMVELTRL